MEIKIRKAGIEDAEGLLDIYAYYVLHTAVSFEYEVPSLEEFRQRIRHTLDRYPYILAEAGGRILGYAYAGPFKQRAAYDWSVETSIYVSRDARGRGIGSTLLNDLESILKDQHILNVNACIGVPAGEEDEYLTFASMHFHEKRGYRLVGTFHKCGYKFGRWYDMIWMEKMIGEHRSPQPPFLPFHQMSTTTHLKVRGLRLPCSSLQ